MKTLENNRYFTLHIRFFNILMLVLVFSLSIIDKEISRVKFWRENQNKIIQYKMTEDKAPNDKIRYIAKIQ